MVQSTQLTVLYVEDNYIIQNAMMSFLSGEGVNLLIADNGAQALSYIFDETVCIDALLTDVDLGDGVNGWEVAECARAIAPAIPVVYASSVSQEDWLANAVPFSILCTKPFRPSHVLDALSSLTVQTATSAHAWSPNVVKEAGPVLTIVETRADPPFKTPAYAEAGRPSERPWVVGPLGQKLYKESLPSFNVQWTPRRKAEIVAAYAGGLLSAQEVQENYGLSAEEFAGWQRSVERFGMAGLRQTRVQQYRDMQQRTQRFGWSG